MNQEISALIDRLRGGCLQRYVGDGSDSTEVDEEATNAVMDKAAIILQAVFDPENQPNQFGIAVPSAYRDT